MPKRYTIQRRLPYLLLAPSVIVLLALILYPLAFALRNSFWFWNLQTSPMPLYHSGWDNYRMVFQVTPFAVALKNTLLLGFLGTFAQFWFGMGIALLLHTHLRGMGLMRAALIMPTTLAPVVAGFLFRYLLEPKGGILPWLLGGLGFPVPPQGFLGNANTALFSIGLVDTWQWTPFFAIVLYAGLLSINEEVKEAAQVDGASGWRMFWSITLPLLRPIAAFLVMIRFMQLFNSFDLVFVLTSGGPGTASRTLSFNLYREGLVNYNIGLTAAMTWLVVIIVSVIINLYLFFIYRKREW
ncbi:MAG: sugar ABC transporter permease [Chloroflexota bacterium]|nr:sugar ABC transporter permease [Chloroflexota bacterium]MDE2854656.1 sugar ABC transporter permease [Chloroflexota bacterium]MDE2947446.1 sugar ABC transporter permease [Chloroflexota bacterium]